MTFFNPPPPAREDHFSFNYCICDFCGREVLPDSSHMCLPCHRRALKRAGEAFEPPFWQRIRGWWPFRRDNGL